MAPIAWSDEHRKGEESIFQRSRDAGWLARGARESVDSIRYLIDLDGHVMRDPPECFTLGHPWEVVERSHARWATATSITAVDVAAACLARLYCPPRQDGRDVDLHGIVKKDNAAHLPAPAVAWAQKARTDPRYNELVEIRHRFLHRVHPTQGYLVSQNPLQRMALVVPRTMKLRDGLEVPLQIDVLIPEVMETAAVFAQDHVAAFLVAAARGDL